MSKFVKGLEGKKKAGSHCSESHLKYICLYLQLMELSVLPVIKLEFLFHCDAHSQPFLSCAGLLKRKETKYTIRLQIRENVRATQKCGNKRKKNVMTVFDCAIKLYGNHTISFLMLQPIYCKLCVSYITAFIAAYICSHLKCFYRFQSFALRKKTANRNLSLVIHNNEHYIVFFFLFWS